MRRHRPQPTFRESARARPARVGGAGLKQGEARDKQRLGVERVRHVVRAERRVRATVGDDARAECDRDAGRQVRVTGQLRLDIRALQRRQDELAGWIRADSARRPLPPRRPADAAIAALTAEPPARTVICACTRPAGGGTPQRTSTMTSPTATKRIGRSARSSPACQRADLFDLRGGAQGRRALGCKRRGEGLDQLGGFAVRRPQRRRRRRARSKTPAERRARAPARRRPDQLVGDRRSRREATARASSRRPSFASAWPSDGQRMRLVLAPPRSARDLDGAARPFQPQTRRAPRAARSRRAPQRAARRPARSSSRSPRPRPPRASATSTAQRRCRPRADLREEQVGAGELARHSEGLCRGQRRAPPRCAGAPRRDRGARGTRAPSS